MLGTNIQVCSVEHFHCRVTIRWTLITRMTNDVQNETGECYDEQSVNIDQVSLSNQLCVAVKLIAETPKEF